MSAKMGWVVIGTRKAAPCNALSLRSAASARSSLARLLMKYIISKSPFCPIQLYLPTFVIACLDFPHHRSA